MKILYRLSFAIALLFIGFTASAQPFSLYGLTLGQKYKIPAAVRILEKNATDYIVIPEDKAAERSENGQEEREGAPEYSILVAPNPEKAPRDYRPVYFDFDKEGKLFVCTAFFGDTEGLVRNGQILQGDSLYTYLRDSLAILYEVPPKDDGFVYIGDYYSVTLARNSEFCLITYRDIESVRKTILSQYMPSIQSSFFGLQLGKPYTQYEIKRIFMNRGEFLTDSKNALGKSYIFKEVLFGGHIWDICSISVTVENVICRCAFYDSKDNTALGNSEAMETYRSFKERLDEKYKLTPSNGEETIEEGNIETKYIGLLPDNHRGCLSLYNRIGESQGNELRIYIGLEYSDVTALAEALKKIDNEL